MLRSYEVAIECTFAPFKGEKEVNLYIKIIMCSTIVLSFSV